MKKTTLLRVLRVLVPPLAVALPPLWSLALAARRASLTPLGRDQGIFQYVAWALSQGLTDYRDVRDVNGPLTHMVHLAFLKLGGADEHRFRVLDLAVSAVAFAVTGAMLPGATTPRGRGRSSVLERAGWAAAACVVLGAQYLGYLFWDLAQRESFCDWFVLASVGAQLAGHARNDRRLLAVAGGLSFIPWLGKPTYALFTAVQIVSLLHGVEGRRARVATFAVGGLAGALLPLAFLVIWGDPAAYVRIAFVDVPAMYRFIWPRSAADIFAVHAYAAEAALAVGGAILIVALMARRRMSPRLLPVGLFPVAGLLGVLAQAKGFPYHFHPVTAGIALQWLTLAIWAQEAVRGKRRRDLFAPLAACFALAGLAILHLSRSPHLQAAWLDAGAATPELRSGEAYFDGFPEPDFFPWDMRQAAAYLREHTGPGERVEAYGMDPYVLFLASRLGATPYIYAYDLDADAALAGGSGAVPDAAQAAAIRAMRDAHQKDLLERLEAAPPAAFVFIDRAPLMTYENAAGDFAACCPGAAAWVDARYEETARFGADHVWLRRAPPASAP